MTVRRAGPLFACVAMLLACAPGSVMRDGVAVPYEQAADEDLGNARIAYESGELKSAQEILEAFLIDLPESRRTDAALLLLGDVYVAQGDPEKAALAWRRLVREYPRSRRAPRAAYRASQAYRDLGRPELGRRILEDAPKSRAPDELRVRMYRLLADLARETGDYAEAVRALAFVRRDLQDEVTQREVDLELQELIQDRLRDSELEAVADELPRGPVYDRVLLELGSRQLARGDFAEALVTLNRLPQRLRPADQEERDELMVRARRGAETAVYPVGLLLPLSGPFASLGEQALRGVVLGLELFSELPGRYRLIVRDTRADPDHVGRAVSELISEGARVIIGPMSSSVAAAAVPYAERARVPLLTLAKRQDIPLLGEYVFRLGVAPADQTPLLAEYVARRGETRRFAVLYPRDAQGIAFKNLFWEAMEELGGTVVGAEGYAPDAVDVQPEIRRLVGLYYLTPKERKLVAERDRLLKRPSENAERLAELELAELPPYVDFDALFIPDVADRVGLILPQLRFYDIEDVMLIGPADWNDPRLLEIAGRDARGAVFTAAFHPDSQEPNVQDFVASFYSAYGARPDLSAAIGYDAAALVRAGVVRMGHPSSNQVRELLLELRTFRGVSGLAGFDDDGVPRRQLQLLSVSRGRIVALDETR